MSLPDGLLSVGVLEKDDNGDVLWTWVYPCIPERLREVLLTKSCLTWENSNTVTPYVYGQYQHQWYYITSDEVSCEKSPKVTQASLILLANDFNPSKYQSLGHLLLAQFVRTYSPVSILESYLRVVTRGECTSALEDNAAFRTAEYDVRLAYADSKVIDVVQMFGLEFVIIYTALLLKKRIVVFHPDINTLATVCRSLPAFVWHRKNWSIVYPFEHPSAAELADLQSAGVYVAGFTDGSIESRSDIYDVYVNAYAREVNIAPHAKDVFVMGRFHKDLATFFAECTTGEKTDQQCIKEIAVKTRDLLNNLKALSTEEEGVKACVPMEALRAKQLPASTETFLLNLAASEGLLKI